MLAVAAALATPSGALGATEGVTPAHDAPTVSDFTAAPTQLGTLGGPTTLSATVSDASSCVFSSNRPIAGWPVTVPCANGPVDVVATLPVPPHRPTTYQFLLRVVGSSTVMAGANLFVANLSYANLSNADLNGTNLTGADLAGADLNGITWLDTTCPDGTLSQLDGGTCLNDLG